MVKIGAYEVVRFASDGLVLITANHQKRLEHPSDCNISARIVGDAIVAGNQFLLEAVPAHLLGYFRGVRKLVFAELFAGKVVRMARLELCDEK